MDASWLDWFGYLSSAVILVSLMMSSIVKLRWINLLGAMMFAAFGFMIGSIPTGSLNLGIAIIDMYYLVRIYRTRDELAIVSADPHGEYFKHFWRVNRGEIERFFGQVQVEQKDRVFFYLRNNNTAGVLIGFRESPESFRIKVDYVTPQYRDFRIGQYFIAEAQLRTVLPSVTALKTTTENPAHQKYLARVGFEEDPELPNGYRRKVSGSVQS